jgi:hypothetical protein
LPLAAGVLLFFIVYFLIQIVVSGNDGNCGCFGEHIKNDSLTGHFKKCADAAFNGCVYFISNQWQFKYNALFLSFIGVSAVALPFIVNPIDYTYSSNNLQEKVNYPLELDLLYDPEDTAKVENPTLELRKGKHVLAFLKPFLSTLPYCRKKFPIDQTQ